MAKQRTKAIPLPVSRSASVQRRLIASPLGQPICLHHRDASLRSQFATSAMQGVAEVTDIVLARGPRIGDLDPTAVLFNRVPVSQIVFEYFQMGSQASRVVNAKRGPGAEIQVARLATTKQILEAERYTFGFTDDVDMARFLGGSPIDRQAACVESARTVTIRSAAEDTHWRHIRDTTSGDIYNLVVDATGNEWNVAGTMDAYITEGVHYFRGRGIPRDHLELALFGRAQDAAIMDARFRESRMGTQAALVRPDAAAVRDFLKVKEVHMIPSALGLMEEPVPGTDEADEVYEDLLPADLAVLFYRGLPRSSTPVQGEQFWAWDFEVAGHPKALEPIDERRSTSIIWAWQDARRTLFQSAFALAWENTYDASVTP